MEEGHGNSLPEPSRAVTRAGSSEATFPRWHFEGPLLADDRERTPDVPESDLDRLRGEHNL